NQPELGAGVEIGYDKKNRRIYVRINDPSDTLHSDSFNYIYPKAEELYALKNREISIDDFMDKLLDNDSFVNKDRFGSVISGELKKIIETVVLKNNPKEFEYSVNNGIVYVSLGKGEYKVTIPTAIKPENLKQAKLSLKEQYHIQANMFLFWQWMKDISLGDNIMVLGVPGTGKTVLTNYFLNDVLGYDADMQTLSVQSSGTDLLGEWSLEDGEQVFKPSLVVKAMLEGKPVIIDEVDKPRDETALAALNNILQSGFVTLPDGATINAKKGFFVVSAGNLPNKGGTASAKISGEVMDRHSVYILEPLSREQTEEMLKRYAESNGYKMPEGFIKNLVNFHYEIMKDDKIKEKPSVRTLEKTIGTLDRDPSRFSDVLSVYLEGFSLSLNNRKKVKKIFGSLRTLDGYKKQITLEDILDLGSIQERVDASFGQHRHLGLKFLSDDIRDDGYFFEPVVIAGVERGFLNDNKWNKFKELIAAALKDFGASSGNIDDIKKKLNELQKKIYATDDVTADYVAGQKEVSKFLQETAVLQKSANENLTIERFKEAENKRIEDFKKAFSNMTWNGAFREGLVREGGGNLGTERYYVNTEKFNKLIADPINEFLDAIENNGYDDEKIQKIRDGLGEIYKLGTFYYYYYGDVSKTSIPIVSDIEKLIEDYKVYVKNAVSVTYADNLIKYSVKNGQKYLDINGVSAPIDNRKNDPRRVKLFLSGADSAKEVFPQDLTGIPETVYYQIGNGEKIPFTFTEGSKELLKQMLTTYGKPESDARNTNLWLEGQTGSGKNALSFVFAGMLGMPMRFVSLHANTTPRDISERTVIDTAEKTISAVTPDGRKIKVKIPVTVTKKQFSEIYEAAQNGELVIIDEVDKVKLDGVLSALNTVFTRDRISGLKYDPRFRVIVLSNDHEKRDVSGKDLNVKARDFISRLAKIEVPYPTKEEEIARVMGSVFGDLVKGSKEYNDAKLTVDDIVTVAATIRNNKVLTRPLSPRSVLNIAKHLKIYPKDKEYMHGLINAAYGSETLSANEQKEFNKILKNILGTKGLDNEYPKDFLMGYDKPEDIKFEYDDKNGTISLGKGEYKVTISIRHPELVSGSSVNGKILKQVQNDTTDAPNLKDHYHLPANMLLFWQWMKDINLGNNIMLLGVPGTGKTVLAGYLLNDVLGMKTDLMQLNVQSSGTDLLGEWGMENGKMVFKESFVIKAMQEGKPVIIDEVDKPRDETALAALNNILQYGFVTLPDGRVIYAKKGFFIVSLGNMANKGGTASARISGEVLNRHSVYILEGLPKDQTAEMLKRYAKKNNYRVADDFIEALVDFHEKVANDPNLPYQPNMRTLEKTIGTAAQDPSRYLNIAETYLEGFSLREPSQEMRVYQIAKEQREGNKESFYDLSQKYALTQEDISLQEDILKKLNVLREKFDASEKHRAFTDGEFLGLLMQVSRNGGDVLGVYDYAVKTLGLKESDTDALKDIENLYFDTFLDEILNYEVDNKPDIEKIKKSAKIFSMEIRDFETLKLLVNWGKLALPEDTASRLVKFREGLNGEHAVRGIFTDDKFLNLLKQIIKNDGDVIGVYDYTVK
ncbi:MAG: AAA family ATPase, partial [Endomicrobia bacterium]|nr:AAA family ATPase [Endomicrobiia bacterium]